MSFQFPGFQFPGFQHPDVTPVTPGVGGGGFAQGGGKRHLPCLEELDVFCRLEKRKRGQSIIECLREMDEPQVQEVLVEAAAEVAAIKRAEFKLPRVEFRSQMAAMRTELAALQGFLREDAEQRRIREEDDEDDDMFLMGML